MSKYLEEKKWPTKIHGQEPPIEFRVSFETMPPGFFEWHTPECAITFEYEVTNQKRPHREYFCHTHHQWCSEFPVKITATYEDGMETVLR